VGVFSTLVQYNSRTRAVRTTARLRWEWCPGREFFVVHNEQRGSARRPGSQVYGRPMATMLPPEAMATNSLPPA